jgi:ribosomal protein S13
MVVTIIKPAENINAKHKCRFKPLEHSDILGRNQFNINYSLLMSRNSIFKVSYSRVSFKNTILAYKKSGIRLDTNVEYNTVGFSTLKAINGSLVKIVVNKEYIRQRRSYAKKSFNKKNLKYFLIKSGPPCNGQRTKTNAKTCKRGKREARRIS